MLVKDNSKIAESIRNARKEICFSVINRGKLWYNRLTEDQLIELEQWYQAWLDAPKNLVVPRTPMWINSKLESEEITL